MNRQKPGILKRNSNTPSSKILQEEAKRMEEKLVELRQFMEIEKKAREQRPKQSDGGHWRSGTQKKPINNYSNLVLSYKPRPGSQNARNQQVSEQGTQNDQYISTDELLGQPNEIIRSNTHQSASESVEIKKVLESCGMEKYLTTLLENGIDDMEILFEINEEHLTALNIPMGHRLKIMKRIRELKGEAQFKNIQEESTQAGSTSQNFNMFAEAFDNFRKTGSATQHKPTPKGQAEQADKKVRFNDNNSEYLLDNVYTEAKPPKSLLMQGDTNFTIDSTQAAPQTIEVEINSDDPLIFQKKSCWNCFKIYESHSGFVENDREFCSKTCVDAYLKDKISQCECEQTFFKVNGTFSNGKWYCGDNCEILTKQQQEEQLKQEEEENFLGIDPITGDPVYKSSE